MTFKEARKLGREMMNGTGYSYHFINYTSENGYYPTKESDTKTICMLLKNGEIKHFDYYKRKNNIKIKRS